MKNQKKTIYVRKQKIKPHLSAKMFQQIVDMHGTKKTTKLINVYRAAHYIKPLTEQAVVRYFYGYKHPLPPSTIKFIKAMI